MKVSKVVNLAVRSPQIDREKGEKNIRVLPPFRLSISTFKCVLHGAPSLLIVHNFIKFIECLLFPLELKAVLNSSTKQALFHRDFLVPPGSG